MQAKITVQLVERLAKTPPEKRLVVHDTEVKGFQLRQSPSGAIAFWARVWTPAERWVRLGDYPAVGAPTARRMALEARATAQAGQDPSAARREARAPRTVGDALGALLADLERRQRAPATLRVYRRMAKHLGPILGRPLAEVTYDDVQELHHGIKAAAAADHAMRLLRAVFYFASHPSRAWVTANPVSRFEPRHQKRRRSRALPGSDLERLAVVMARWREAAAPRRRVAYLLQLLILTGARVGEAMAIERRHVHLAEGYVESPMNKEGNPAKQLTLGPAGVQIVRELMLMSRHARLFHPLQRPPYVLCRKLFDEAGVPWQGTHMGRHTWASMARASGLSMEEIGALLGHSSAAMTELYAVLSAPEKRVRAERVDQAIAPRLTPRRQK